MNFKELENVKVFQTKEELFRHTAEELEQKINSTSGSFYLAISGGSTPSGLYQLLDKDYQFLNWEKVELFWVDERMVPPENPESNYGAAIKYFKNIPPGNIHRIKGENDPDKEALRYAEEIKNIVQDVNGLPSFDWILLGIGNDGHTASIFPGEKVHSSADIVAASIHPQSGQKRVTLTENLINNAKKITFLVTGKEKKEILDKVLSDKESDLPAARIKGNISWYLGAVE